MYDIDALEKSWKRYRMKRFIRYGGGVMLILAAGAGSVYFFTERSVQMVHEENDSLYRVQEQTGVKSIPITKSKTSEQTVSSNSTREFSGSILAPTVPSLTSPAGSSVQKTQEREHDSKEKNTFSSAASAPMQKPKMTIIVSDRQGHTLSSQESKTPAVKLKVSKVRNQQVVRQIEKRFRMTRDYDDAIYLAKYYYRQHRYKQAEYWAMQANTIDSTQEESWMLFGKAKAKRGMRADALKVLQAYYDRTGSVRVKDLIDRIRKGKSY